MTTLLFYRWAGCLFCLALAGLCACKQPQYAAELYPTPKAGFLTRHLQQRLPAEKADSAIIFIGGFSDQLTLRTRTVYATTQNFPLPGRQLRAYYGWDGGRGSLVANSTKTIQKDLRAFMELNPQATLVFVGHSYGGSAVMDVLRHVPHASARVLVLTLDPVSQRAASRPRARAAGIERWINVYCYPYRSLTDSVAMLGGSWRHCPEADLNLCFSGRKRSLKNTRYCHRYPEPLMFDRCSAYGVSAYELLCRACQGEPLPADTGGLAYE